MKFNGKTVYIFDNEGETLDRYTILFPDGSIHGCSSNPYQGIGQFSHNLMDRHTRSFVWKKLTKTQQKRILASEIKAYRFNAKESKIGKELKTLKDRKALPEEVVKYIIQLLQP